MRGTQNGPIFLVGLQRSGTTQAWNILQSQPDTLWPAGELHQLLRPGRAIFRKRRRPIRESLRYCWVASQTGDLLNIHKPPRRNQLRHHADWLRSGLTRAVSENAAQRKAFRDGIADETDRHNRLLVKVMNYGINLVPDLMHVYPNASFVVVTRDLVAVAEGHLARGQDKQRTLALCKNYAQTCADLAADITPISLFSLEKFLEAPVPLALSMLRDIGYRPHESDTVVMQDRIRVDDGQGGFRSDNVRRKLQLRELAEHVRTDVNAAAYARLGTDMVRELTADLRTAQSTLDTLLAKTPSPTDCTLAREA